MSTHSNLFTYMGFWYDLGDTPNHIPSNIGVLLIYKNSQIVDVYLIGPLLLNLTPIMRYWMRENSNLITSIGL